MATAPTDDAANALANEKAVLQKEHPGLSCSGAFPQRLRLRRSRDFRRIQRLGARGHFASLVVILRPCRKGRGRLGLTVSKKVGNAVVRNKMKRRLRHLLREQKMLFVDFDMVVVVQPKAASCSFSELASDLLQAHQNAQLKLQKRKDGRRKRGGKGTRSASKNSPVKPASGTS